MAEKKNRMAIHSEAQMLITTVITIIAVTMTIIAVQPKYSSAAVLETTVAAEESCKTEMEIKK